LLDILIRGGTIVDGTGNPRFTGDVGICGEKIVEISRNIQKPAKKVIDATGLIVSPGFIDVHSHDDLAVLHDESMLSKLMQGVTTTIVGNCGLGPTPVSAESKQGLRSYIEPVLGAWPVAENAFGFASLKSYEQGVSNSNHCLNIAALVAHGALRIHVKAFSSDVATPDEVVRMQNLLQEEMEAGALGLSLGLMYAPGCFADKAELISLAEVVKRNKGIVTAHIRGEGDLLLSSLHEMFDIAREVGVPVHISHLKAVGIRNWGSVDQAIEAIQHARDVGLDVTCDVYPYAAGSTTITSLLPPSALQGGLEKILERLHDPEVCIHTRRALEQPGDGWDNVALLTGFDRVVLTSTPSQNVKQYEGMTFAEIAEKMDCDAIDAYLQVMRLSGGRDTIVIHHMDENDVRKVIQFEYAAIGSDGLPSPDGHPHPRLYGTFPKYIAKYVREEKLLSLEEAIRKITSFSTQRFQLCKRGTILPENYADIVIFDAEKITDKATYAKPRQLPEGVVYVMVNGHLVIEQQSLTNRFPGGFLARNCSL